jgi:hypothetical protein
MKSRLELLHDGPQEERMSVERNSVSRRRGLEREAPSSTMDAPDAEMLAVGRRVGEAEDDPLDELDNVLRVTLGDGATVDRLEQERARERDPAKDARRHIGQRAARMQAVGREFEELPGGVLEAKWDVKAC